MFLVLCVSLKCLAKYWCSILFVSSENCLLKYNITTCLGYDQHLKLIKCHIRPPKHSGKVSFSPSLWSHHIKVTGILPFPAYLGGGGGRVLDLVADCFGHQFVNTSCAGMEVRLCLLWIPVLEKEIPFFTPHFSFLAFLKNSIFPV